MFQIQLRSIKKKKKRSIKYAERSYPPHIEKNENWSHFIMCIFNNFQVTQDFIKVIWRGMWFAGQSLQLNCILSIFFSTSVMHSGEGTGDYLRLFIMTNIQGGAFGELLRDPLEESLLLMKMTQATWKEQDCKAVMTPQKYERYGRISKKKPSGWIRVL